MTRPVLTPLDGVGIIGTDELVDSAVTSAKLATAAVTSAKVQDGSLALADLASAAYSATPTASVLALRTGTGDVQVPTTPGGSQDATSLAYINSLLSPTWGLMPFAAGWSSPAGPRRWLRYRRLGNLAFLSGAAIRISGSNTLGTLPATYRPPETVYVPVGIASNDSANVWASINASGVIVVPDFNGINSLPETYDFAVAFECTG